MSNKDELRNLATNMGADVSDADSNADMIAKIAEASEGGSGGGSDILVVTYNDITKTCDYTFAQMTEAINSGKMLIAKVLYDGRGSTRSILLPVFDVTDLGQHGGIVQVKFSAVVGFINNSVVYNIMACNLTVTNSSMNFETGEVDIPTT